jgi:N5-(carboxyethyl)ornithine synthase
MTLLTVGVYGTSRKDQEKRVPIHPRQLSWIDEEIRHHLFFEKGYGEAFGVSDEAIALMTGGVLSREDLLEKCDIALLAKPTAQDFEDMRPDTIHWGWPHCVQQFDMTQTAIDRRLTLIAWEAMHEWSEKGQWQQHSFHKNNEIAGYAGVLHAMNILGIDGNYGPSRKAVILSFGSVSRGAVRALQARGVHDITVFTHRHHFQVTDHMAGLNYFEFEENEEGQLQALYPDQHTTPFIEALEDADIIVNGILQDTDHPLMFVREDQTDRLKEDSLIIDISCDEGMGFPFARPTTFKEPIFKSGHSYYYAVDHTPSYLWNAASWEISNSLIPYLPLVMEGPDRWEKSETIRRAIEIKDGMIQNSKILSFQNREEEYPHSVK